MSDIAQPINTPGQKSALITMLRASGVFFLHAAIGFTLYREGAVDHWALNVYGAIYLPFLLALIFYFFALRSSEWFRRHTATRIAVSFICAFFSFWFYMVAALNTYGS